MEGRWDQVESLLPSLKIKKESDIAVYYCFYLFLMLHIPRLKFYLHHYFIIFIISIVVYVIFLLFACLFRYCFPVISFQEKINLFILSSSTFSTFKVNSS